MAVITPTIAQPAKGVCVVTWASMSAATSDTGAPITTAQFSRKCMMTKGTFTGGSSVSMRGTNDGGTTYVALNTVSTPDTALAHTAADIEDVQENPLAMSPKVVTGTGTVTVVLVLSKD